MTTKPAIKSNANSIQLVNELPPDRLIFLKGIGGMDNVETIPMYLSNEREVIFGDNTKVNAQIVLGVDRPASRFSGYGGKGHTQASSVDIVVGRMAADPKHVYVDPNFVTDAARIYISQKTSVDENFKISDGTVGQAPAKSAIALKADGIRLAAREGIKLVTGLDKKNSQGGENTSIVGIDLIAGNHDEDMQPLVKGRSLSEALCRVVDHISKLNGIVDHLLTTQMNFNESLTHHYHYSPWYGNPTTPSDAVVGKGIKTMIDFLQETKRSLVTHKTNLVNFKQSYLVPSGQKYINSRWNHTN
jgi:hypothetical protein